MATMQFSERISNWQGWERLAVSISESIIHPDDRPDKAVNFQYNLYYRKPGDIEWGYKNGFGSFIINPLSKQPNFTSGVPLSLQVLNSTLIVQESNVEGYSPGDYIVDNIPEGVSAIGEYDYYEAIITNIPMVDYMLDDLQTKGLLEPGTHGLQMLSLFALRRADLINRLS